MPLTLATSENRMRRRISTILWGSVLVASAAVFLVNCGGGGGSDGESGGSHSESGQTVNAGLRGRFWYPNTGLGSGLEFITDAQTGNTIATQTELVNSNIVNIARDGRLFVGWERDPMTERTRLTIHPAPPKEQVSNKRGSVVTTLKTLFFKTSFQNAFLSPDSRYLAFIYADDLFTISTKNGLVIYDLNNQADVNIINETEVRDTQMSSTKIKNFGWLPGGEYRVLYQDNTIMAGSVANPTAPHKPAGKIVAPAGFTTSNEFQISPDGKQIATFFSSKKELDDVYTPTDVWLTDITGGNPQRLTNNRDVAHPVWSPDGKFIALGSGPGALLNEGRICYRWYVPSTARNATYAKGDSQSIRYTQFRGLGLINMTCPPLDFDWTE
jgi:hypothetical protein